MSRMDSKVVLRNIENKMKVGVQNDGQDQITKKRRAAFTEVSNNENAEIGLKKTKCAKKQVQQPLMQKLEPTVRQPLQVRQSLQQQKPAPLKQQKSAVLKPVNKSAAAEVIKPTQNKKILSTGPAVKVEVPVSAEIQQISSDKHEETMNYDVDNSITEQTEPAVSKAIELHASSSQGALNSPPIVDAEMEDLCSRFEWIDVDKEHRDSPYYVTEYINDIFEYYKQREAHFAVRDYMTDVQNASYPGELSVQMRCILVDWLVEVQQNFELTHETLYLAVKMVDRYLSVEPVRKDRLQLVGACALSVACKYEERCPPILDDYLYVCDDAYNSAEFLEMETLLLRALDFEIGCPLSYTFLRRYAQCARVSIPTLTLARYMIESALIEYQYIHVSESRLAAAALLLAMAIRSEGTWDVTMHHYTGYVKLDLIDLVQRLNVTIGTPPNKSLSTVYTKYSHEVFHKVATLSALSEEQLSDLFTVPH